MTPIIRHLEKLTFHDTEELKATGEDMELLVETLRNLKKLKMVRLFLRDDLELNLEIAPEEYLRLLDIPEINLLETPTKTGEVERISIKENRDAGDPVSAADLNTVLRELNQDLTQFQERVTREFSQPLLAQDITADRILHCQEWVDNLKALHRKKLDYLFSPFKINRIENAFQQAFPNSSHAYPLRATWPKVEHELKIYRLVQTLEERWRPLGLDLFSILKGNKVALALQNVQEMGSLLWNAVYNGQRLKQSFEILGVRFNDTITLFDNDQLK